VLLELSKMDEGEHVTDHPLLPRSESLSEQPEPVPELSSPTQTTLEEKLANLQKSFEEFITHRQKIIAELKTFVEELNVQHKKVNVAKVTGTSVALVGTAISTVGFVSAFFTAGLTLPLTIVGGVMGGLGGATTAGYASNLRLTFFSAALYEWRSTKLKAKYIQEQLEKSPELFQIIQKQVEEIQKVDPNLTFFAGTTIKSKLNTGATKVVNVVSLAKCVGKDLIVDPVVGGMRIVNGFRGAASATTTATTAFGAMLPATQAIFVGGFVFSILATPIDVYYLVKDSKELYYNSPAELAEKFVPFVEQMEKELDEFIDDVTAGHCEFSDDELLDDDDNPEEVDLDLDWLSQ
jgi:chaperonin cofactor prefoldin